MLNQPETPGSPAAEPVLAQPQAQQGKLVLPAYDSWKYQTTSRSMPAVNFRPEQLIQRQSAPPPKDPLSKLRYLWGKDPAYKVLIIAVGMVLIASLVFVSLISNALQDNANFFAQDSTYSPNAPTAIVPTGTVDQHPTFPTPDGGQGSGSSSSSQPPPQATPVLQTTAVDTPTAQPSPTPEQGGTLTVQITNIPDRVMNNSVVNVAVNTSQPNVSVTLYIIYNAAPFRSLVGPRVTDDGGNGTIPWNVSVFKFGGARAYVVAVAKDGNGQRVQSQPATVQIVGFGQGG